MKKSFGLVPVMLGLALSIGCSDTNMTDDPPDSDVTDSSTDPASSESQPGGASFSEVQQEVAEAAEVTGKYSAEKMKEYGDSIRSKLQDLDKEVERLKQEGEELAGDARQKWQQQMETLEEKRVELKDEIDQLREASGGAWVKLKQGVDQAWTELKDSVNEASKEFN